MQTKLVKETKKIDLSKLPIKQLDGTVTLNMIFQKNLGASNFFKHSNNFI